MNIGVFYGNSNNLNHYLCTCGNSWTLEQGDHAICACGCDNFKAVAQSFNGGILTHEKINLIDKGDWGFIAEREKYQLKYNKRMNLLTFMDSVYVWRLTYSFKDNKFVYTKDHNDREYAIHEDFMKLFFKGHDNQGELIDLISTESNKGLYEFILRNFGHTRRYSQGNRMYSGLHRFLRYKKLEMFHKCGYNLRTIKDLMSHYHYSTLDFTKNKPTDILGIPKYSVEYIKNKSFNVFVLRGIKNLHDNLGGNDTKIILNELHEETDSMCNFLENLTEFINLIKNHGYKPKKLITYLTRNIKLEQGIARPYDGLILLKDYIRMSVAMNVGYEKYSKNLKKDHDIALLNFRVVEDVKKREQFSKAMELYQELIYKDKRYSIIIPNEPKDLVNEGKLLSHCVASYVDDVIRGKCKILFMRHVDTLDQSLLTIEVRENNIKQVKGHSNRSASKEEKEFVMRWAKDKELRYSA